MVVLCVVVILFLVVFPCPPWSLKGVIAQRAQCQSNLKLILRNLDDLRVTLDESHADQVRKLLVGLNLTCPEGTEFRGRPALYVFQIMDGRCMITEEQGNHPARARFMAGAVEERRFGIDVGGKILQLQGKADKKAALGALALTLVVVVVETLADSR